MILLSLQWVIACSMQVAALVVFTVLLTRLLRLREPRVRWACFEAVLLLCLCLPLLQTRKPQTASPQMQAPWAADNLRHLSFAESKAGTQAGFRLDLRLAILWLLGAGIVVRAGWLIVGFRALDRLRRTARPCSAVPKAAQELMNQFGIAPRILISDRVGGAITFGLRSGMILLPSRFEAMSEQTQVAILCHELIHVRDRHWLFTAIEECVLAVIWFHPAIWWLVREIQLAREETVDLDVVRTLRARDQYVDALLEAAQLSGRIRLTPATSFVWRGQLARRVATIFAEDRISKWRRILPVGGVIVGTLFVLRAALVCFPARSTVHAQTSGAQPIVIESGGDHLLRRGALEYPRWVQDEHVEGLVEVEVSTDKMGRVLDARVLDGPQELRRPVLRSVLDWQYDPQAKPPGTYQVAVRFTLPEPEYSGITAIPEYPGASVESNIKPGVFVFAPSGQEPSAIEEIKKMIENTARAERGELTGRITRIQTHGAAERMDLHLPIAVGGQVTPEIILRVEQSLRGIDRQLVLGLETEPGDSIAMHIFGSEERRQNEERR